MTVGNAAVAWYLFKVLGSGLLFGFASRVGWLYGRDFLRFDDAEARKSHPAGGAL